MPSGNMSESSEFRFENSLKGSQVKSPRYECSIGIASVETRINST